MEDKLLEQLGIDKEECNCDNNYMVDPILIDTENLIEVGFDKDEFQQGLDDISYTCGMITGLINVGINPMDAIGFMLNKLILDNNLEIAKVNKETSIAVAKEQAVQVDKNSL